jgi:hypothetical protein
MLVEEYQLYMRALISVCHEGRLNELKHFVRNHSYDLCSHDEELLRISVQYGQYEIVKYLLKHGAGTSGIITYDEFVRIAYENEHYHVVELLGEYEEVFSS